MTETCVSVDTRASHAASATLGHYAFRSVIDVLHLRATEQRDQLAFIHLPDGESAEERITYGELHRRACAVAERLSADNAAGKRVLMLFESGFDYVAALFGVFMSGAIAVPSFPPVGSRALGRLAVIAKDAQCDFVLTNKRFSKMRGRVVASMPETFTEEGWIETDDLFFAEEYAYAYNEKTGAAGSGSIGDDSLALLQYTSGSTADPKGVMLTHANLLSNCHSASRWMGGATRRLGCTWLPPYHDMGLMGGILQPIYEGFPTVILSPGHFVQQPLRWLAAITRYRVTTTIAPNFAFDLCCDSVSDEALAGLDLSSLTDIYCGAEPVRQTTLERFVRRFSERGFRPEAFGPCYGLAEATVFVSGKPANALPNFLQADKDRLALGDILPVARDHARAHALASCGVPAPGHDVRIVTENGTTLPDGGIGEIWVSGPNIGVGYWNKPGKSQETFYAKLEGSADRYMRTGDLGFLWQGELYVTGRMKDLIIVAGRNLYPQDIELLVQETDARIRPNGVAAFSIDNGSKELIAIVVELRRGERFEAADLQSMHDAIVERVASQLGAAPHAIHFAPIGTIPLTTSGKVQRHATRQAFLAQSLASYLQPRG